MSWAMINFGLLTWAELSAQARASTEAEWWRDLVIFLAGMFGSLSSGFWSTSCRNAACGAHGLQAALGVTGIA